MCYLPATIFFVEQARLHQPMGMLGNIFKVAAELVGNLFQCHPLIFFNQLQDSDAPMISRPLKISL